MVRTTPQPAPMLRSPEELEGALLLPTAEPVYRQQGPEEEAVVVLADSMNVIMDHPDIDHQSHPYYYYDSSEYDPLEVQEQQRLLSTTTSRPAAPLPEAPVIPDIFTNGALNRLEATTRVAERRGLQLAEQEKEDIDRANRRAFAQNYMATAEIQMANEVARQRKWLEEAGYLQTSTQLPLTGARRATTVPPKTLTPPTNLPRKLTLEEEEKKGSFGKEYEVNPYDVDPYDGQAYKYDVAQYKSVYDP